MLVRNERMASIERCHSTAISLSFREISRSLRLATEDIERLLSSYWQGMTVKANMEDIHGDTLSYRATRRRRPAILRMLLQRHNPSSSKDSWRKYSSLTRSRSWIYLLCEASVGEGRCQRKRVWQWWIRSDACGAGVKGTMLELLKCGTLQAAFIKHSSRQLVAWKASGHSTWRRTPPDIMLKVKHQ